MAYADNMHCVICDAKTIYDAEINYEYSNCGDVITLCKECIINYKIIVTDKNNAKIKLIPNAHFLLT